MKRQITSVLAILATIAAVAATMLLVPGSAAAHGKVHCGADVGRGTFDPVVHPGHEPSGHDHMFVGNRHIMASGQRANASYDGLAGAATNCGNRDDSAAYWFPTVTAGSTVLRVDAFIAYYYPGSIRNRNAAVATEPFPPDARMVAGRRDGSGTERAWWMCGAFSTRAGKYATPAEARCDTARPTNGRPDRHIGLRLKVWFPDCWDGRLNSHTGPGNTADFSDDGSVTNHFAYSRDDATCPTAFPRKLPSLLMDVKFDYRGNGANVTIASGAHGTLHADFWNTWVQSGGAHGGLNRFTSQCVNRGGQGGHPHGNTGLCGS